MGAQGHRMEDLDEKPSRFHELNNAIHSVAVTVAVIKTSLDAQGQQSGRIESAVSSVNVRLDRFDVRMNDTEKSLIGVKADLERQIAAVKSEVETQVMAATSGLKDQTNELKEQMALFSPVKLIVYGAVVLILTAFMNVWVTNAMISRQESERVNHQSAPKVP